MVFRQGEAAVQLLVEAQGLGVAARQRVLVHRGSAASCSNAQFLCETFCACAFGPFESDPEFAAWRGRAQVDRQPLVALECAIELGLVDSHVALLPIEQRHVDAHTATPAPGRWSGCS